MVRYRIIMLPKGKPKSRWRPTRAEAIEDAIALKLAERDEHDDTRIWWHPLVEIEEDSRE
jgi:hypothetical protein